MKVKATYRLDEELVDRLARTSKLEGRTQTWYVTKALNEYFDKGVKPASSKPSQAAVVVDYTANKVIDYLNAKAGTKYRHTDANKKLINTRLKDYSLSDMCAVIDKKCAEWKGTEFEKYLRPSTLFNATKFENYVNEKVTPNGNRLRQNTKETPEQRCNRLSREMAAKRTANTNNGAMVHADDSVVSTQVGEHSGGSN